MRIDNKIDSSSSIKELLEKAGIATPENCAKIVSCDPHFTKVLAIVWQANLLNQENFTATIRSYKTNSFQFSCALTLLQEDDILNQESFDVIIDVNSQGNVVTDQDDNSSGADIPHETAITAAISLRNQKNKTNSKSFFASLFASKQPLPLAVAYLKSVYQREGGSSDQANKIFDQCANYKEAIEKLQARYREKECPTRGATYKTLLQMNKVSPAQSSAPQPAL